MWWRLLQLEFWAVSSGFTFLFSFIGVANFLLREHVAITVRDQFKNYFRHRI